jgi:membrane protein
MLWLWMSAAVLLIGDQLNVTVGEDIRAKLPKNSAKDVNFPQEVGRKIDS